MTDLIYTPGSRANEYSQLAVNIFRGCDHSCEVCYVPLMQKVSREQFAHVSERAGDFLGNLEREAARKQRTGLTGQILLCFSCDPFCKFDVDLGLTRQVIQILHRYGFSVCTLTKGGKRALRDLDLFTSEDAFASTLTCWDSSSSLKWEPGAALPNDRMETLKVFHDAGITTWVSFEPVLYPDDVLRFIDVTKGYVDHYKVGVLNYHMHARTINWKAFAEAVTDKLDALGLHYFIKTDLRKHLSPDKQARLQDGWSTR